MHMGVQLSLLRFIPQTKVPTCALPLLVPDLVESGESDHLITTEPLKSLANISIVWFLSRNLSVKRKMFPEVQGNGAVRVTLDEANAGHLTLPFYY